MLDNGEPRQPPSPHSQNGIGDVTVEPGEAFWKSHIAIQLARTGTHQPMAISYTL
jgi:hypothetical protein